MRLEESESETDLMTNLTINGKKTQDKRYKHISKLYSVDESTNMHTYVKRV